MKKSNEYSNKEIIEYQEIMNSNDGFVVPVEWSRYGDTIQKFSLYEEYTPVKTSGGTTLIIN